MCVRMGSINGRFQYYNASFSAKTSRKRRFFYAMEKVFNIFKLLKNRIINIEINIFQENFQRNAQRIEKCCTFAPAELNEGLPLKMI